MSRCAHCKPLHGAEAQVLRLKQDVREFIRLLTNAREDGGLTTVQCEVLDKLMARHEAVLAGQAEDAPDVETLLDGWDCLREIAVEIGEVTLLDLETFDVDDRTEIQPRWGLQCRIRALVCKDATCVWPAGGCCGHTGPRTAVAETDHE